MVLISGTLDGYLGLLKLEAPGPAGSYGIVLCLSIPHKHEALFPELQSRLERGPHGCKEEVLDTSTIYRMRQSTQALLIV